MRDFHMEGISKIDGGEFDTIRIEGVGTCTNHLKARSLHIEGVFNCFGETEAEYLYCEGVADFKSSIRSKKINVQGVLSLKEHGAKMEAEEIICEGVIHTKGEISADRLEAEGCIEAKEIVGDFIKINSRNHRSRFIYFMHIKSEIKLIEATTISLCGVKAETVNGTDIVIGPNCRIESIDCSGFLTIDRSSTVKNITGNYTMRG